MTTTDDKELIARIQAGDTAAYRETMKRYGTPIFTLIRRIVGSREDAEELTQDVFLKAFDRKRLLQPARVSIFYPQQ